MNGWDALEMLPQTSRTIHRRLQSKANAIYPQIPNKDAILADNYDLLKMKERIIDRANADAPSTIDADGFAGPNAIVENFNRLRTVSGAIMSPVSIVPVDNQKLTENLNLISSFKNDRHHRIWTSLHTLMFGKIDSANASIRKLASTGFPHCTNDLTIKKQLLFSFAENFSEISSLLEKGELERLFFDKQLFFASASGLRLQPDKVDFKDGVYSSKDRLVNDLAYAESGGETGSRFPADKTVYRNGTRIDGHFAMRARTVWGAPFAQNYYVSLYMTLFRAHYLETYDFTWKHRTAAEIQSKLMNYSNVIGVDVAQFDQSVSAFILDFFCDSFVGKLDDKVINLMKTLISMPYFQADPNVGSKKAEPIFMGDPFNLSTFKMRVGLPSGISPNPDIGKFACTATYLCLFDDHFHNVLEVGVDTILRGKHPEYALLNAGDDCVLMTNNIGFRVFFNDWVNRKEPYYLRVEPEVGISFLGNVISKTAEGKIQVTPNINSFIVNWLVPENGIDSRSRRDFHFDGWDDRKSHFSKAPMYDVLFGIWEEEHHHFFKESLNLREDYCRMHSKQPTLLNLTDIDREVMANPDKLNYKFSNSDISQSVLDTLVSSIPFSVFYPLISPNIFV